VDRYEWEGLDELLAVWLGAVGFRCLGRKLQPFSLFHRELLRLIRHPLIEGKPVNLVDLETAVRVCSVPGGRAGEVLRQKPSRWKNWMFAVRALRWARRLEQEEAAFRAYLKACCVTPDVATEESDKERPLPALLNVLHQLSSEGHSTREVGGEWPAGLADWMYMVSISRVNDVKWNTDEDRQFLEGLRTRQALKQQREREIAEEDARTRVPRPVRILREVLGRPVIEE
jgi:hypothetical protein